MPGVTRLSYVPASAGGGGGGGYPNVEYHTITLAEETAKSFNLSGTPTSPATILVDLVNGPAGQQNGVDFNLVGNTISWNALGWDGMIHAGDVIRIAWG